MIYVLFFTVCLGSSAVGAICGIGGGIIIKPVLDSLGILDTASINFLSGCTVLSMTVYSVLKERLTGSSLVEPKKGIILSSGAALGGLAGKQLFSLISGLYSDQNHIGAVQSALLLLITLGTLLFLINQKNIHALCVNNILSIAALGCALGIISSFLGIGGGPINLVVLFYFFSMPAKTAAEYSLYIILFSQSANILTYILTDTIPKFQGNTLLVMAAGGILGGIIGRKLNQKISASTVNKLLVALMLLIIFINLCNIWKYLS